MTVAERFWVKVQKTDGCWLWTGCRNSKGYGNFRPRHSQGVLAHRFAYVVVFGPIPEGRCVLHRCDQPACVRPDHLFLGTIADNNADMVRKKRHHRGERTGTAKLDYEKAAAIRAATGSHREIAAAFGVHQTTVTRIRNRRIWNEVTV